MNASVFPLEIVCKPDCLLAEGPLWNVVEKRLYFTDIENCCLWRCNPYSGQAEKFYQGERRIGGFAFNWDGTLVLGAENSVLKLYPDGKTETLWHLDFPDGERFNDLTTDPAGRIFAGTMMTGLYRIENGKAPIKVLENVNCSNGMTFSPDEKTFYHTSTKDCRIDAYEYDVTDGSITGGREWFKADPVPEWPDGLTSDNTGCLWAAFWSGGIKRISPAGDILGEFEIPAEHPTSLVFGGEHMDELFITTATDGIFRLKTAYQGRREWPAKF